MKKAHITQHENHAGHVTGVTITQPNGDILKMGVVPSPANTLVVGSGPPFIQCTEEKKHELAWQILDLLDGVQVNDAWQILTVLAPALLRNGHVVNMRGIQMQALREVGTKASR